MLIIPIAMLICTALSFGLAFHTTSTRIERSMYLLVAQATLGIAFVLWVEVIAKYLGYL